MRFAPRAEQLGARREAARRFPGRTDRDGRCGRAAAVDREGEQGRRPDRGGAGTTFGETFAALGVVAGVGRNPPERLGDVGDVTPQGQEGDLDPEVGPGPRALD